MYIANLIPFFKYKIFSWLISKDLIFFKLLELYQNKKINNNQLLRIYYWSLYQNLQWYLVALYKDNTNFNPNINFKKLANDFLKNANYFYQLIKENNNI